MVLWCLMKVVYKHILGIGQYVLVLLLKIMFYYLLNYTFQKYIFHKTQVLAVCLSLKQAKLLTRFIEMLLMILVCLSTHSS